MKFPLVLLCFSYAAMANAAEIKEDTVGCKDVASVKKTTEVTKAGSKSPRDSTRPKVAEGGCRKFQKKTIVEIDAQEGQFTCVRPPGELECMWTSKASVNEYPGGEPNDVDAGLPPSPMFRNKMCLNCGR